MTEYTFGTKPKLLIKCANISFRIEEGKDNCIDINASSLLDSEKANLVIEKTEDSLKISSPNFFSSVDSIVDKVSSFLEKTFNSKPQIIREVIVRIPKGTTLNASLTGAASLICLAQLDNVVVDGAGSQKIELSSANNLSLTLLGASKAQVNSVNGDLTVKLTGASKARCSGTYKEVTSTATGASKITILGNVSGDFSATAIGACKISHYGSIQGKVTSKSAGASSVNLESTED